MTHPTVLILLTMMLPLCTLSKHFVVLTKFILTMMLAISFLPLVLKFWSTPGTCQLNPELFSSHPQVLYYTHAFILSVILLIMRNTLWHSPSLTREQSLLFNYMVISLLALITMLFTSHLFLVFIAWQTLSVIALLLPNMYYIRTSVPAALRTLFCNLVGSAGFILVYYHLMKSAKCSSPQSSLDLPELLKSMKLLKFPEIYDYSLPTMTFMFLFLVVATNLIHLTLYRGLVMAVDTPPHALILLHITTMMAPTALLLMRFYPMLTQNPETTTICLFSGASMMLYSAVRTLTQSNSDNIINYPAAGQLGIMMLVTGLNLPHLVPFYACVYMIMKAMMSLSAEKLVHPSSQMDIRNLESQSAAPIIGLSTGSVILTLTPIITLWHFQNSLIQAASMSIANLVALMMVLTAAIFTTTYSIRLICTLTRPFFKFPLPTFSLKNLRTSGPLMPLICALAATAILLSPLSMEDHPSITMPLYMKLTVFSVTVIALILAYFLALFMWNNNSNRIPYLWADPKPPVDPLTPPHYLDSVLALIRYLTTKVPLELKPMPPFPFLIPAIPPQTLMTQGLLARMFVFSVFAAIILIFYFTLHLMQ